MDKTKFRLIGGLLILLCLLNTCRCQQSAIFNPSPFQRRQQTQQLRQFQQQQQQQRQQAFPNALGALNPLNAISPISPIVPQVSTFTSQSAYRNYNQLNPQNFVPITAYQNEINYDGSFAYGYSAGDGTTAQAQGYVKNLGLGEAVEAQVVEGSYSYTSPEGTPITVRYIADENGFRAEGAHIPTPPPIPEAIAKSLQYASSLQPYQQQGLNPNLNPFQTPYRQFPTQPTLLRPGQQQLTPLQLQQQQQQQRIYQQQNSGQYQPDNQFGIRQQERGQFQGSQLGVGGGGGGFGQFGQPQNFQQQQQANQQNLTQQQKNLQNLQQQQQSVQQQQQKQQQEQQQDAQQQQLATQELRGRPSQLVNPFGYNQYRRYKKATKK